MKNPNPVNLQSSAEVRERGWQAESRDAEGHLISCHAPIEADDQGIAEWIVECTSRGETVTFWPTNSDQPPPPSPHVMGDQHPDDIAVDRFAAAMKAKLAKKRGEGFGGWDDPDQCHIDYLVSLLMKQIYERAVLDPVDIANLSMMIHERGETPDYGR